MSELGSLLQVRSKIWLEIDGEPVFGKGRDELLLPDPEYRINQCCREIDGDPLSEGMDLYRCHGKATGFPSGKSFKGWSRRR